MGVLTNVAPAAAQTPDESEGTVELTDEMRAAGLIDYSCGPNFWPYDYYPTTADRDWWSVVVHSQRGNGWLYGGLYYVWVGNAYNNIYWTWGNGLRGGDKVSLDWSDDGGATYHACHATVPSGRTSVTTRGVNQWGGRSYRSCVRAGTWQCTPWRHDLP